MNLLALFKRRPRVYCDKCVWYRQNHERRFDKCAHPHNTMKPNLAESSEQTWGYADLCNDGRCRQYEAKDPLDVATFDTVTFTPKTLKVIAEGQNGPAPAKRPKPTPAPPRRDDE